MNKNFLVSLVLAIFFFVVAFLTIPDYNISWDEILHFSRGQVYVNYFLTGKKEYPKDNLRKSYFQIDYQAGDFWFKENGGHPPVSDILAAFSNYVFYQKLGILTDIGSYHLFNIAVASLLVFVIVYFAITTLGMFPAFISFLILVSYPLFFAESHFNVKDIPETAFFSGVILTFYLSFVKRRPKLLLLSFVFFGLALGTKFNALFLPLIIVPYFVIQYKNKIKILIKYSEYIFAGVLLTAVIFIASWPFLWNGFPGSLIKIFDYYRKIGTGTQYQSSSFYIAHFNTFPVQWILFTTPPVVLVLVLFGLVSTWLKRKSKDKTSLLWLLWLFIPILRVSIPGSSVYGGIRQILEFFPAMALLGALGSWQILRWLKGGLVVKIFLIAMFLWPGYVIIKMHPNQNVYFNSLIGGLKGAYSRNFPSWGNSYGNAYLSGINWLNKNAETGSKVALIQGTRPNAPPILLRSDIILDNKNWSGIARNGEYLMELVFNDTGRAYYYTWEYVDKFLEPVYELRIDGVVILKIWKNDIEHTKKEYRNSERQFNHEVDLLKSGNVLFLDFGREIDLSRINLVFRRGGKCTMGKISFVEDSVDGKNWYREKDWIPFPQLGDVDNLEGNVINFYFAGRRTRFVHFILDDNNSCVLDYSSVRVYTI